jgi:hypothetical protein
VQLRREVTPMAVTTLFCGSLRAARRFQRAHVSGVARAYHMGGPNHGKVFLRNPKSGKHVELHVLEAFAVWLSNMATLLERLRNSAIAVNAL